MSKKSCNFDGIKAVLKASVESRVTIVLVSCQRLVVEVDAVVDDLLIASIDNRILFIDINCICVVINSCEEVLEFLLSKAPKEKPEPVCGFTPKKFEEEESYY